MEDIHVGRLIKRLIEKKGIKKTEFAKQLNYSQGNISSLFKRDDWTLKRVLKASKIIDENILAYFMAQSTGVNTVLEESPVYLLTSKEEELGKCRTDLGETKELLRVLMDQNKYLKEKILRYEREAANKS